tara:strand:- start:7831 stop:8268 length:438 start_codon:yes stop_codon:yes gene_type:complete
MLLISFAFAALLRPELDAPFRPDTNWEIVQQMKTQGVYAYKDSKISFLIYPKSRINDFGELSQKEYEKQKLEELKKIGVDQYKILRWLRNDSNILIEGEFSVKNKKYIFKEYSFLKGNNLYQITCTGKRHKSYCFTDFEAKNYVR